MPQLFCSGACSAPTHSHSGSGSGRNPPTSSPSFSTHTSKWSGGAAQGLLREGLHPETPLRVP